jgi:hypothetical protein
VTQPATARSARILRPLVVVAALLACSSALCAAPSGASTSQTGPAPKPITAHVTQKFSPNGDGRLDVAALDYELAFHSDVTIAVRAGAKPLLTRHLGDLDRGKHQWRWDGRVHGKVVPDGQYRIDLTWERSGSVTTVRTRVDTRYDADLRTETYGRAPGARDVVYPRTTGAVDALALYPRFEHPGGKPAHLVIRNDAGEVVSRKALEWSRGNLTTMWTGRRQGRPLPPGKYRAHIVGEDLAGNRGHSEWRTLWVSRHRLELVERSVTVPPSETAFTDPCSLGGGNDCAWWWSSYCGQVLPSDLFPGGQSYRSAVCPPDTWASEEHSKAISVHLFQEADAVHGLRAFRVAFTGAPTYAGESDAGTLAVAGQVLTSSSGARSDWVTDAYLMNGQTADPYSYWVGVAPSAFWTFSTSGDDAFDVAVFTLDLQYLALPG